MREKTTFLFTFMCNRCNGQQRNSRKKKLQHGIGVVRLLVSVNGAYGFLWLKEHLHSRL